MSHIHDLLERTKAQRTADAKAFAELDENLCMLCQAYGPDKRGFSISCGYEVKEVIPEALDLAYVENLSGYYLRVCKGCRGALLEGLKKAADQRRGMRAEGLDSDGESLNLDYEEAIFVRINGANVCMTRDQFNFYKQEQQRKRKEG